MHGIHKEVLHMSSRCVEWKIVRALGWRALPRGMFKVRHGLCRARAVKGRYAERQARDHCCLRVYLFCLCLWIERVLFTETATVRVFSLTRVKECGDAPELSVSRSCRPVTGFSDSHRLGCKTLFYRLTSDLKANHRLIANRGFQLTTECWPVVIILGDFGGPYFRFNCGRQTMPKRRKSVESLSVAKRRSVATSRKFVR